MAITKSQFVSDVELQLLQSAPSDDAEIEKSQIAFVGSYFLNALVAEECNSKVARGEQIPSVYVTRAAIEVPEIETTDEVDEMDERIFVEIPEVLTLNNDAGVQVVQTEELDEIQKVNIQSAQLFRNLRFSRPSAENLTYYRAGNNLYLNGFKPVDIEFTHILVDYVPKQDITQLGDSDEILCSDLVYPSVVAMTVQSLIRMLYGTEQDISNDGIDVKQKNYHTSISNRNDQ